MFKKLAVACVLMLFIVGNVWGSSAKNSVNARTESVKETKEMASLPIYAQKYANSQKEIYSLSAISLEDYTEDASKSKIAVSDKNMIEGIYFDKSYLARFVSTDNKGVLNVYCEITESGNIYVYDLYSYKGKGTSFEARSMEERKIIDIIKARYLGEGDIDTGLVDDALKDSVLNGNVKFDSVEVTDLQWGKLALTDNDYSRVLVEFMGEINNKLTNNYVLLSLTEDGKIKEILLI